MGGADVAPQRRPFASGSRGSRPARGGERSRQTGGSSMIRVPPGRAGQVWIRRRLETARRGIDILARKQRLLAVERELREPQTAAALTAWTDACAEAELWCARALRIGHEHQIPMVAAHLDAPASITVD